MQQNPRKLLGIFPPLGSSRLMVGHLNGQLSKSNKSKTKGSNYSRKKVQKTSFSLQSFRNSILMYMPVIIWSRVLNGSSLGSRSQHSNTRVTRNPRTYLAENTKSQLPLTSHEPVPLSWQAEVTPVSAASPTSDSRSRGSRWRNSGSHHHGDWDYPIGPLHCSAQIQSSHL